MGTASGHQPPALVKFLPENNLRFSTISDDEEQRLFIASPQCLRDLILFAINTRPENERYF